MEFLLKQEYFFILCDPMQVAELLTKQREEHMVHVYVLEQTDVHAARELCAARIGHGLGLAGKRVADTY